MGFIGRILFGFAVLGLGFACGAFGLSMLPKPKAEFRAPERAAPIETVSLDSNFSADVWPDLFGVVDIAEPAFEPEPEPEPVIEVAEPETVENATYWLTGLVAGRGSGSWAMISENDRSVLVRIGDELIGGETVTDITNEGVWIEYQGARELIPMQRANLDGLISIESPLSIQEKSALRDVLVQVEAADRDYLSSLFYDAAAFSDDTESIGLEVLFVANGALFDQLGLKAGDKLLSINGNTLQSEDLLTDISDAELEKGLLDFEIQRGNSRQVVRVTFEQG